MSILEQMNVEYILDYLEKHPDKTWYVAKILKDLEQYGLDDKDE